MGKESSLDEWTADADAGSEEFCWSSVWVSELENEEDELELDEEDEEVEEEDEEEEEEAEAEGAEEPEPAEPCDDEIPES